MNALFAFGSLGRDKPLPLQNKKSRKACVLCGIFRFNPPILWVTGSEINIFQIAADKDGLTGGLVNAFEISRSKRVIAIGRDA